jgi:hypothetical protein
LIVKKGQELQAILSPGLISWLPYVTIVWSFKGVITEKTAF